MKINNFSKVLTGFLVTTTACVSLGTSSFAAKGGIEQLNQDKKVKQVSESQVNIDYGTSALKIKKETDNSYSAKVTQGNQSTSMAMEITPAEKDGEKGYNVKITDTDKKQVVVDTFTTKDATKLLGVETNVVHQLTAPEAAIAYHFDLLPEWAVSGAVWNVIGKIDRLGWWGVASELFAEGYAATEIAGLLIASVPELGLIGVAAVA